MVRSGDVLLVGRRLAPVTSAGPQQAQYERDHDHNAEDDQDDGERRHGASVYGSDIVAGGATYWRDGDR
jgi:hypothetical protein